MNWRVALCAKNKIMTRAALAMAASRSIAAPRGKRRRVSVSRKWRSVNMAGEKKTSIEA